MSECQAGLSLTEGTFFALHSALRLVVWAVYLQWVTGVTSVIFVTNVTERSPRDTDAADEEPAEADDEAEAVSASASVDDSDMELDDGEVENPVSGPESSDSDVEEEDDEEEEEEQEEEEEENADNGDDNDSGCENDEDITTLYGYDAL
ncbi:hypothetical protein R3P38DRAFT_2808821 [Favolaschia claudopus]|uniref:Uncharacterized protein n=1 Tax=Favolaschia claudopus TaxID=2862362 RepID=A0AAV9ZFB9_9AGAR